MKKAWLVLIYLILSITILWGQNYDSTTVLQDTTMVHYNRAKNDSTHLFYLIPNTPMFDKKLLLSDIKSTEDKMLNFEIGSNYNKYPSNKFSLDVKNIPKIRYEYNYATNSYQNYYDVSPFIIPLKKSNKPLAPDKYAIPTREELDVLQILWTTGDTTGGIIYSKLDTTSKMTMTDLNNLLESMTKKGMLNQKLVSPQSEVILFLVRIELSSLNRKNREYLYSSNVDEERMKRFIIASAYILQEDSSFINQKQYEAVLNDSTLLKDLLIKIYSGSSP